MHDSNCCFCFCVEVMEVTRPNNKVLLFFFCFCFSFLPFGQERLSYEITLPIDRGPCNTSSAPASLLTQSRPGSEPAS